MTTKILALVVSLGKLVKFRLMPRQYDYLAEVKPLIEYMHFQVLVTDKAFDAN